MPYPVARRDGHTLMVALVSIFIGGWLGNIINGQAAKGVVILFLSIIFAMVTCGASFIITYPLSLIDAILGARKVEGGYLLGPWELF